MKALNESIVWIQTVIILGLLAVIVGGYIAIGDHFKADALEATRMDVTEIIRASEAVDLGTVEYDELRTSLDRLGESRRDDVMAVLYLPSSTGTERRRHVSQLLQSASQRPGFLPAAAFVMAYRNTEPGSIESDELAQLLEAIPSVPSNRGSSTLHQRICGSLFGIPHFCKQAK